jgi:hypothetical protein
MSLGFLLLLIIGIALIILMIWNLISIKELKMQGKRDRRLDDPRYFELKYKQEFFIATVSLVATVLVIFGYNSLQNVEDALKKEFENKTEFLSERTDSIMQNFDDSLNSKISGTNLKLDTISTSSSELLSETSSQLLKAQRSISGYSQRLLELSFQQKEVDNQFKVVQNRINEVNSKNILKLTFYMVDSLLFDTRIMDTARNEEGYFMQYYFKDMRNIYGDKLPKFTKPPFIVTSVENTPMGLPTGTIKEITTESFKFNLSGWNETNRVYRFSILIFEKP